jgi:pimeloyl-ACP methyl ester carboxylesterase
LTSPVAPGSIDGYVRHDLGYREGFTTPVLGGGRTLAVHTEPIGGAAPITWVVLHSFGPEHDNLAAFDASLCRALAASGHAAIRYHAQGHGDSELGPDALGLEAQVAGALDAVGLARDANASGAVGLIGSRLGAAVAALAAARADVRAVALVDPTTKGRAFLRSLVRLDRTSEVSLGSAAPAPAEDPFELARAEGFLEIEGFAVSWPAVVELEAMDLLQQPIPSDLPALVLQVSRSDAPRGELRRLAERLGPRARLDVLAHDDALRFGLPPWRVAGAHHKVDSLAGVGSAIVERAVRWCVEEASPRG